MRILIFLLAISIASCQEPIYDVTARTYSAEELEHYLSYVNKDDKIGYINLNGKEIIPVEFESVLAFSEQKIGVKKEKWGFYNHKGEKIIDLKYDEVKNFSESLAPVKINGKFGYINPNDSIVIPFKYDDAKPFLKGKSAVKIGNKWGIINKKGEFIIPPKYDYIKPLTHNKFLVFHETYSMEYVEDGITFYDEGGKYGLINEKEEFLLDTIYDEINDYQNGLASISLNYKEGFIDTNGKIVIPIIYDDAKPFFNGQAIVGQTELIPSKIDLGYTKQKKDSMINELAKLMQDANDSNYHDIFDNKLMEEFQMLSLQEPTKEILYSYINKDNEKIIENKFNDATPFINGLAKVRYGPQMMLSVNITFGDKNVSSNNNGYNLINEMGENIFQQNKSIINITLDSNYIVYGNNEISIFDKNANLLFITNQYENISYAFENYFIAKKNDKKAVVLDKKNRIVLRWNMELSSAYYNRFIVYENEKYGIINLNEKWIVPIQYDFISEFKKV